uniref:SFRICE_028699 n=1 Tax=Spodoptera frugiperda TaxID=7108 RepID=A0A2H1X0T3_SPOFR
MSSEGSVTSSGSRIRQFGLYRTIDARTEEFLRSSRKRQIRQGCACAAISTAITVTVVVVILLIYEYAIAVEWSLVQNKQITNRSDATWRDQPFADRLDRSYFGLDQDYYERMPLLINALQESSYFDPTIETTGPFAKRRYNMTIIKPTTTKPTFKPSLVRRTSPRPFFFEYRSPTPLPFSKTYGSRSWIERYRNEERLKNIRQIIKYLENTINAKSGDLHSKPSSTHIAFTGVYIEPMLDHKGVDTEPKSDLQQESSENINQFKSNHLADPLFNFKPESPGEVNLLADDFLRFAPVPTPSLDTTHKYPMFRQIPFNKRNCLGNKCEQNFPSSIEIKPTEAPPLSTTKSFSVMLNLFPIKKEPTTTVKSLDSIYLTTSRPLIQFKRKSNVFRRRIFTPYKRPKYLSNIINKQNKVVKPKENENKETPTAEGTQMIVHVKVYSPDEKTDLKNETIKKHLTIPSTQTNPYTTKAPIELSSSEIEDHHIGSSGYIPVEASSTEPTLPKVTTILPFFEYTTEHWPAPTEVFQFNAEDAKVPNQYLELERRSSNRQNIQISRRNSGEEKEISDHEELSTLIVKLKNEYVRTTTEAPLLKSTEKVEETTTEWTYVPQINGHYRNINQNSKNGDTDFNANPENNRKKRLEQSVSGYRTYVPMYVEIKRNHSQTPTSDSEDIVVNKDSE